MKRMILILRRDEANLLPEEKTQLENAFPGDEIEFQRIDPTDCHEHDRMCDEYKANAVILPLERPIPEIAMKRGVVHLTLAGGKLQKLVSIKAEFSPFLK
jgi:hypothetical protein